MINIGLTTRVEDGRERRDCIDQAWYPLLSGLGCRPVLLPNFPDAPGGAQEMLRELRLVGVILTGGNDLGEFAEGRSVALERDRFESELISAAAATHLPLLGVCRGFQKLAVRYGAMLQRVRGHVAVRHRLDVDSPGPMPLGARDEVNSYHDFGLSSEGFPSCLKVVGVSADGLIEAAVHESLPQWGIMWHPERAPNDPRDLEILKKLFVPDGTGRPS